MKKLFLFISIFLCAILLLSSGLIWGRYNSIMKRELSNIENYTEYTYTLIEREKYKDYVYMIVTLAEADETIPYSDECRLEVIPANAEILKEKGFFDEVEPGDTLTIKADLFTYGDADFFFVASVKSENKSYLDEETAMYNIIKHMLANSSLL